MNAYARMPVSFVRGEGVHLWDEDGKQYLDALGGIAVTFLGHCHPKISEIISLQATRLLHCSNLFHIQEQAKLGEQFCRISGMDKAFFTNSGTESNEAAIKIARLYGHSKNIETPTIITAHGSFHGRTMGSLSATGKESLHKGFTPMLEGFAQVDYNNVDAVAAYADNDSVVAVMIEPIQGESGIVVPDEGYLQAIRTLCDQHGWLLIVDEIQSGMGRTGKWFAHQHEDIIADVVTSAKALGNGIPIGVCAARGKAADLISPGSHGTTFGGNPFACQVASNVIDIIEQQGLVETAANTGTFLKRQLQQKLGTHPKVVDIRGKGLMLGVELDLKYDNLAVKFLDQGLVVSVAGDGKVIRMLPSVLLTENQARQVAATTSDVVTGL